MLTFRQSILAGLALWLAVFLVYLQTTGCGFIWDDDDYILKNNTLRSWDGLADIWLRPQTTPQYYPLVFTTFLLEYQTWELWAPGYHITNLLLHSFNTLLLWAVLVRLKVPGAWLGAALFGIHPVQVESVAWITERKNVLSAFLYFLSLLAYLRFSPLDDEKPWKPYLMYGLALIFFLGALASKTVTCSLPAVIVLLIWWKRGVVTGRDLLPLLPFFAVGLASGLFTAWWEKVHVGAVGKEFELSIVERILLAGRALCFYAEKLLFPVYLVFIYPRWRIDSTQAWQYGFPILAVALLIVLWMTRNRLGRGPLVGALCFAGTLFPALGFFNIYPFRYSYVADHFQYLASAAFLALVASGLSQLKRWSPLAAWGIPGALLLLFGALTYFQCITYLDLESLYLDTLEKNPECWMAHGNLGKLYLDEFKEPQKALEHLQEAVRLGPNQANVQGTLGNTLMVLKRFEEAESCYRKVVTLDPKDPIGHNCLGVVQVYLGKDDDALTNFDWVLDREPTNSVANLKKGQLLIKKGRKEEAILYLLRSEPELQPIPERYLEIAMAFEEAGDPHNALKQYRKMVSCKPQEARLRLTLALALQRQGLIPEAKQQMEEALSRDPQSLASGIETVWNLSTSKDAKRRNGQLALDFCQALVAKFGPRPDLLLAMGAALAELGQFDQAVTIATKALESARINQLPNMQKQLETHLDSYRNKKPIRAEK